MQKPLRTQKITEQKVMLEILYKAIKLCLKSGRERGIRTPGGMTLNGFQDRRYRPLSHLPTIQQFFLRPN